MGRRIEIKRGELNGHHFVQGTDYLKMGARFDAISMAAEGELTVGRIHKFFVTEALIRYDNGAKLLFADLPHQLGEFKSLSAVDEDHGIESLLLQTVSPATLTTPGGEEIVVTATLSMNGITNVQTGETAVSFNPPVIVAAMGEDGVDPEHPFLSTYRGQTCTSKVDYSNSGYRLQASANTQRK